MGPKRYFEEVYYLREFRGGTQVGQDAYGNRYFEIQHDETIPFCNRLMFLCSSSDLDRKRYVITNDWSDDSTKIPADWHGWLHATYDDNPTTSGQNLSNPSWSAPHTVNFTGSNKRYVPYSTTQRKILPWEPSDLREATPDVSNPALPK